MSTKKKINTFGDGDLVITTKGRIGMFAAETSENLGFTYYSILFFNTTDNNRFPGAIFSLIERAGGYHLPLDYESENAEWIKNKIRIVCQLKEV